ncbi:protein kinase [Streptomyces sp. cmx-18-6]|uniref:protein kinase n=1 Tax=Streptomyces sp. cmx-18-6 TaxID=2790930 RepID=UPI003980008E
MDDYAGRVLADRYRLPLPPSDGFELAETRAFDTYSGQEVLVRQVPLPEIVDAEMLDADGRASGAGRAAGRAVRRSTDPAVRRAIEAAQAAAQVPDHPRLDQVFDVFAEAGSLWIVSELVAARPLAALLAERPLNPYRAAEIASDVLTALRVLHAHGWTHRNITVRTVLVCDDGRVMLTGLAAGAAEEALCGYAPEPLPDDEPVGASETYGEHGGHGGYGEHGEYGGYAAAEVGAAYETQGIPVVEAFDAVDGADAVDALDEADEVDEADEFDAVGEFVEGDEGDDVGAVGADGSSASPGAVGAAETGESPGGRGPYSLPHSLPPAETYDRYDSGELPAVPPPYVQQNRPYAQQPPQGGGPQGQEPEAPASGPDGAHGTDGGQELVPRPAAPAVPYVGAPRPPAEPGAGSAAQLRAARAGAIAAYRAGARAAARVTEDRQQAAGNTPAAPTNLAKDAPGGEADTATPEGEAQHPPAPFSPGLPAPRMTGPWGGPGEDPYDDEDDEDDEEGPRPPGRRVHLAGTWDDGPGSGRSVPAGGSGQDALRADSRRPGPPSSALAPASRAPVADRAASSAWEEAVAGGSRAAAYRGPETPLAAERARQARIAVVGPVTERWAPEQAGPVHENWRLAPPIGPSTDLWALGALLYRAVQGHAPYPEENAAELVQMVCAEPPAFAEECGALRPVVESLLRQDPTERPDFEELRGWLRSLVRSAPEPEAGADVVPLPAPDATRLPVVRRRGELVRRRRGRFGGGAAHGRHRQGKGQRQQMEKRRAADRPDPRRRPPPQRRESARVPEPSGHPVDAWESRPSRAPREPKGPRVLREPARPSQGRSPRHLGRLLLILILLLMAAAVAYAFLFLPKQEPEGRTGASGQPTGPAASAPPGTGSPAPSPESSAPAAEPPADPGSQQPQTSRSAAALASGYELRKDAEGFAIGVPKDWQRSPANADRQIRYGSDGFTLLVVPGRDTVKAVGGDPLDYQRDKQPELQPFRDSSWSTSSGLRRVDVGRQAMAEGQFTWQDSGGREVYVRNLAMIVDGRYHIIQVIGPENDRDRVSEIYRQAVNSYRVSA